MALRRADGSGAPWTWGWALPRYAALLVVAVLVFRVTFDLSWAGTVAAVAVAFGGAALLWGSFAWRSRKGPITFRTGGLVSKAVGSAIAHEKLDVRCTECGWHGSMSTLVRGSDEDGRLELRCPVCGFAVGHAAT